MGEPIPFALSPGRRQRLGDQLYGQILEKIVSGQLREGDRLPPEKELCELFGVSRPIVREALLRLRVDGLLQARQGAGTYVMARPADRLASFASMEDVAGFLRCIEIRLPLEGAAARLAAERRTPDQLDRIAAAHREFERDVQDARTAPGLDLRFHAEIAAATGNALFPTLLATLNEALLGFMRVALSLTRTGSKERARRVLDEHEQVLDAIRAQDQEAAELAMRFHITQARRRIIDRTRHP
jgi:GntR family transcriptional repressor for pyruvate dehydrogenase complex